MTRNAIEKNKEGDELIIIAARDGSPEGESLGSDDPGADGVNDGSPDEMALKGDGK